MAECPSTLLPVRISEQHDLLQPMALPTPPPTPPSPPPHQASSNLATGATPQDPLTIQRQRVNQLAQDYQKQSLANSRSALEAGERLVQARIAYSHLEAAARTEEATFALAETRWKPRKQIVEAGEGEEKGRPVEFEKNGKENETK